MPDLLVEVGIDGSGSGCARVHHTLFGLGSDSTWQNYEQAQEPYHRIEDDGTGPCQGSGLLEFDQRAIAILGVKEQHRLAMRADFRLAVSQKPYARFADG